MSLTADRFRELALALPDAEENAHQKHPDFRVGGKVFATLGPELDWAMVKLASEDQEQWTAEDPQVFETFAGAWGRQGCTRIQLDAIDSETARRALRAAWLNVAPKRLHDRLGETS